MGRGRGQVASSQQIGASLGLAALGTAAHRRTGSAGSLNDGYALGLMLGAVLLAGAVLVALTVLPRKSVAVPETPSLVEEKR